MDIATPRNAQLSGFYRRSNAVMNATERIPNCLSVIVGELSARLVEVRDQNGTETADELKEIINKIDFLRYEIIEDFPFRPLVSTGPDVKFYNDYLEKITSEDCTPTMLNTKRIYSECYVYRRIWECFEISENLKHFDPYRDIKNTYLTNTKVLLKKMAKCLLYIQENPSNNKFLDFDELVRINLWSNKRSKISENLFIQSRIKNIKDVDDEDQFILCNHSKKAWNLFKQDLTSVTENIVVDFILDTSGYELFLDFCLADFLTTNTYVTKIRFHVKSIPWLIWCATANDIEQLLDQMKSIAKPYVQILLTKWNGYIENDKWEIVVRKFWCLPANFKEMKNLDPWLYKSLTESTLIIIKGDMNYHKAVGDINWSFETPLDQILKDFRPSNILLIRVITSDLICGLNDTERKKAECIIKKINKGCTGVIQFIEKGPEPKCFLE